MCGAAILLHSPPAACPPISCCCSGCRLAGSRHVSYRQTYPTGTTDYILLYGSGFGAHIIWPSLSQCYPARKLGNHAICSCLLCVKAFVRAKLQGSNVRTTSSPVYSFTTPPRSPVVEKTVLVLADVGIDKNADHSLLPAADQNKVLAGYAVMQVGTDATARGRDFLAHENIVSWGLEHLISGLQSIVESAKALSTHLNIIIGDVSYSGKKCGCGKPTPFHILRAVLPVPFPGRRWLPLQMDSI